MNAAGAATGGELGGIIWRTADPTDRFDLSNKIAVVTGSSRGIGRGLALGLAGSRSGSGHHEPESELTARRRRRRSALSGGERWPSAADVTDPRSIEELARAAEAEFGRVDILVNNAGSAFMKAAEELTEEDWDRVMDVDLKGRVPLLDHFRKGDDRA